jgi:hypothetical protein
MLCICVALVVTGTALAAPEPPPGFIEAPVLERVASYIAGRPVEVWCANNLRAWRATAPGRAGAPGYAIPAYGQAFLRPNACKTLIRPPSAALPFGSALLVLVHEATHLTGLVDEYKTECLARKRLAEAAIRFYGFKPHTMRIRLLVARALNADPRPYACQSRPAIRTPHPPCPRSRRPRHPPHATGCAESLSRTRSDS